MWYYLTLPTLATSECSSSHHVLVDADDRLNKSPVLEGENHDRENNNTFTQSSPVPAPRLPEIQDNRCVPVVPGTQRYNRAHTKDMLILSDYQQNYQQVY